MPDTILYYGLAGAAGIVLGVIIGAILFSRKKQIRALENEIKQEKLRSEAKVSKAQGDLNILQLEQKNLSFFISVLPQLYSKLSEQSAPQDIARIFLIFLEKIFEPTQLTFFFFNPSKNLLELIAKKGLPEQVPLGYTIQVGQGKIGWSAQKRLIMDEKDFETETYMVRQQLEKTTTVYFKIEICAPITFYDELLGIVSMGNLVKRYKSEKVMMKMLVETATPFLKTVTENIKAQHKDEGEPVFIPSTKDKIVDRTQFVNALDQSLEVAQSIGNAVIVSCIEIDNFHLFIQNHGITAGENAISLISKLILAGAEKATMKARFEEALFGVFFVNETANDIYQIINSLRHKIETYAFPVGSPRETGHLTVSCGMAVYPYSGDTLDNLLSYALHNTREAHSQGGNIIKPDLSDLIGASSSDFTEVDLLTAFEE